MSLPKRILMGMGVAALTLLVVLALAIGAICIAHYTPDGWEPLTLALYIILVAGTWIGLSEEEL